MVTRKGLTVPGPEQEQPLSEYPNLFPDAVEPSEHRVSEDAAEPSNRFAKRMDTTVNPEKDTAWFGYKEESYPMSTEHHAGVAQYIGALRNEFSDPNNSAHVAAQQDLRSADNSVRASLEAHAAGDFHLATQHLDAAALRVESADNKANASDPAMRGVDPVHATVADYKRRVKAYI
jgi:hypothetical protein